jgi:hypothetical protein
MDYRQLVQRESRLQIVFLAPVGPTTAVPPLDIFSGSMNALKPIIFEPRVTRVKV